MRGANGEVIGIPAGGAAVTGTYLHRVVGEEDGECAGHCGVSGAIGTVGREDEVMVEEEQDDNIDYILRFFSIFRGWMSRTWG